MPAVLKKSLLLLAVFLFGVGVGHLERPGPPPPDYEIRSGRQGLTNPLLECEIRGYRAGRELRPFRRDLEALTRGLRDAGRVGRISVYFRDLDNGPWFGIREDVPFAPASLLKVPLIIACLKQAETEPDLLARRVTYRSPARLPPGSPSPERGLAVGESYSVEELLRRTAVESDNAAALLLSQAVDGETLRRVYVEFGIEAPPGGGGMGGPAQLSALDYGRFFRVLYNASYLGRAMSERALGLLARSSFRSGLVAGVPGGTLVAHKYGLSAPGGGRDSTLQLHDCGIVYHPRRPYFLCVMTQGSELRGLEGAIADISRLVHDEVERQTAPSEGQAAVAGP